MTNRKYAVGDCFYLRKESVYMKIFEDLLDLSDTIFIVTSVSASLPSISVFDVVNRIDWPAFVHSVCLKATTKKANQICNLNYTEIELDRHFVVAHFSEEEKEKILSMALLVGEVDFE